MENYQFLKKGVRDYSIFTRELLPFLLEKLDDVKDIVDLTEINFSMAVFRKICRAKNIDLYIQKKYPFEDKSPRHTRGSYIISFKDNQDSILDRIGTF